MAEHRSALVNPVSFSCVDTVLVLGSHADDIEIGCGGTLLELARNRPEVDVHWVVLSARDERGDEARGSAKAFLAGFSSSRLELATFKDGFFPHEWKDLKLFLEKVKKSVSPDLILTHHGNDLHQDHRIVSELTWNTFRNHAILEYEIPKYDGDLGNPNAFVPLPRETVNAKIDLLFEHFATQTSKAWFDRELFSGLMRLRGMECNASEGFAEAFHARKIRIRMD